MPQQLPTMMGTNKTYFEKTISLDSDTTADQTMSQDNQASMRPAYEFSRTADDDVVRYNHNRAAEDDCSSVAQSDGYVDIHTAAEDSHTVGTAANFSPYSSSRRLYRDATAAVHEMHLALLYLLSNPEEFERAASSDYQNGTTTLAQWNAEYGDNESLVTTDDSVVPPTTSSGQTPPLPYVIFADDAEVVLPQAHTASQLFGIETITGMELEAAAGVPALSQLFLRWLALMPGGDHLNLIDPPGLTVMRIAGGRYRVTAAHSVVWTWMNEFAKFDGEMETPLHSLKVGDLVRMTIVDVFETDNQGKLLSYCPTFDNRAIEKTDRASQAIRKQTASLKSLLRSPQVRAVAKQAGEWAKIVKQHVGDAVHNYNHSSSAPSPASQRLPTTLPNVAGTSLNRINGEMERYEA